MEYECEGFLEKNRDTVYDMLVEILRASKVGRAPGAQAAAHGVTHTRKGRAGERSSWLPAAPPQGFVISFFFPVG